MSIRLYDTEIGRRRVHKGNQVVSEDRRVVVEGHSYVQEPKPFCKFEWEKSILRSVSVWHVVGASHERVTRDLDGTTAGIYRHTDRLVMPYVHYAYFTFPIISGKMHPNQYDVLKQREAFDRLLIGTKIIRRPA